MKELLDCFFFFAMNVPQICTRAAATFSCSLGARMQLLHQVRPRSLNAAFLKSLIRMMYQNGWLHRYSSDRSKVG